MLTFYSHPLNFTHLSLTTFPFHFISSKPKQTSPPDPKKYIPINQYNTLKQQLSKTNNQILQIRKIYTAKVNEMSLLQKRQQIQIENIKKFSITKFAKSLLNVHDNLSYAISISKSIPVDNDETISNFIKGIHIVNKTLQSAFNANGITKYTPSIGEKFVSTLHESLYEVEIAKDNEKKLKQGSVYKVICDGFKIHNRVLRPAKVAIVKYKH